MLLLPTVFESHQKCRFEFSQGPKFAVWISFGILYRAFQAFWGFCAFRAKWDFCDIFKHCVLLPCLLVLIIMIRDLGAAVNNGGNSKLLPTCIMTTLTKRHPPTVTWEMHLWLKLLKKRQRYAAEKGSNFLTVTLHTTWLKITQKSKCKSGHFCRQNSNETILTFLAHWF